MAETGGTEFASRRRNRGNIRRRPRDDEGDSDAADEDTEVVRKSKVQKAVPLAFSTKQATDKSSAKLMYEGSRSVQQASDQGATRTLQTETETDRDGRRVTSPSQQRNDESSSSFWPPLGGDIPEFA